eukprot:3702262-Amphidinium_carterae.1
MDIVGVGLAAGDWVRVFRDCGDTQAIAGLDPAQMESPSTVVWAEADFSSVTPGSYTVCWCSKDQPGDACQAPSSYVTLLTGSGGFTIRGPLPGQSRQCDRGFACIIQDVAGTALGSDSAVISLECGTDGANIGSVATGMGSTGASGIRLAFNFSTLYERSGIYRMCWCEEAVCGGNATFIGSQYKVEIGILTLRGPFPVSTTWDVIFGKRATITLDGVQLEGESNAELRIMERCGLCDNTENGRRPQEFDRPSAARDSGVSDAQFTFSADTMERIIPARLLPPDIDGIQNWETYSYCLCWCLTNCSTAEAYTVDVQEFRRLQPVSSSSKGRPRRTHARARFN